MSPQEILLFSFVGLICYLASSLKNQKH